MVTSLDRHVQNVASRRPKQLAEINPAGMRRFKHSKCETCRHSIMNHWILPFVRDEERSRNYCYRDGTQYSGGLAQ